MENAFVDFRAVKAAVSMQMVLDHYGVNWLRKKGDELRGRCPIHQGEGTNTFHVSITKHAFQCFSCKARGNVLDLVAAMENCSVRDAAIKLTEWFSHLSSSTSSLSAAQKTERLRRPKAEQPPKSGGEAVTENEPLKFQLKGVDPEHPYLRRRGISKETAEQFGLGFFAGRGLQSGRVVIPIHNERGELLAYAGRAIDEETDEKYRLPSGFQKSRVLYNLHCVIGTDTKTVVLVEGYFGCIKVHEAGFPCVALMGSSLSDEQERLLRQHFTGALLLFDGDTAGRDVTDECLVRLGRGMWVKAIELPEGKQPDMLDEDAIRLLLEGV